MIRWIRFIALTSLLTAGVAAIWPPDALRGTMLWVPLVVIGLSEISAWGRRHGGGRTPPTVVLAEAAMLAALVAIAWGRSHLSLPGTEPVLIAGFVLLLAHRLARLVLSLRPSLGRVLPQRPPWPFFVLPLLVYLAILPWSTSQRPPDGDEPWYLLITHSLAYDFDIALGNNYAQQDSLRYMPRAIEPQPGDPTGAEGERYSRHATLLPIVLAPAYRVAGGRGAMMMMACFTAALAWVSLSLARHYVRDAPGEALAAWAILAFAPPLLLYSHQVWVEVPAALLSLLAIERIYRLRAADRLIWRELGILALLLALLPLLKLRFLLLSLSLLALAWLRVRRLRLPMTVLGLAFAAFGALLVGWNYAMYGQPFRIYRLADVQPFGKPPEQYAAGLLGPMFDSAFGLLAAAPVWLLLIPSVFLCLRKHRRLLMDAAVYFGLTLFVMASRSEWFGGWSPPTRYTLAVIPLLAIMLVPFLRMRRRAGAAILFLGLLGLTLFATALWVAVPGWTYNLAHGSTHLLDHLGAQLRADVARFFPSYVRPAAAAWLWPLAATVVLCLICLPRARRSRRAPLWAATGCLLAASALPVASLRLPTRVVEFEDTWILHESGALFPERWKPFRVSRRGSWRLPPGGSLSVPVVPGGRAFDLEIDLRADDGPAEAWIVLEAAGGQLATWRGVVDLEWRTASLADLELEPGEWLQMRLLESPPGGVLFDRARIDWR